MRKYILILAFSFSLFSCGKERPNELAHKDVMIEYRRNGNVKMLSKLDTFQQISDTVLRYSCLFFSDKDTSSQVFHFPIGTSQEHIYKNEEGEQVKITLKKQSTIHVNGESFLLTKYFFDVLNRIDEERIIYFHKELGILKQEGYTWKNLLELHSSSPLTPAVVFGIQEGIRRHFPRERKHIPSDIAK